MDSNFHLYSQIFSCFIPLLVFLLLFSSYFLNAEFRKGSLQKTRAHYQESFVTEAHPVEAFKAIMQFATQNGYRIDDFDQQKLGVILNERMTLTNYGSLYPIYVREHEGKTLVEVGVTSKLGKVLLISPINKRIVTLGLERMLNSVKGAIFAFETKK